MNGSHDEFQLLIKPAGADCNLRCAYCFYLRTSRMYATPGPHRMSDRVLAEMIRQSLQLRRTHTLFSWQGGEPALMGLDFFRRAAGYMKQFGSGGQTVGNAFQTNGLLLDEAWADFFREHSFLVGISIDGPPALHDHYRGHGSHRKAMAAAQMLVERGVEVNLLSVVSDRSRPRDAYDFLVARGFKFLQFIPAVELNENGDSAPFNVKPGSYGIFLCELFDRWLVHGYPEINVRLFTDLVLRLRGQRGALCTFSSSCDGYLVVEHDGGVYPCDFFVTDAWRLGNLTETSLPQLAASELRRRFAAAKNAIPDECTSCRWMNLCRGGCLKDRLPRNHGMNARSALCDSYKTFFEHAVPRLRDAVRGRVRRNDPCPCGSGKKFKHCCATQSK